MSDVKVELFDALLSHLQQEIYRASPVVDPANPFRAPTSQEIKDAAYAHGLLYAADHIKTILVGKIPHVLIAGTES